MYFYIDESGHTGPNLFDPDQPMLYYGVLSSDVNVDVLAEPHLQRLRQKAKVRRLHANVLGNGGLVPLVDEIAKLQRLLKLRFDIYRLAKPDHAIISFYDQVFDHGNNPATTWTSYWTPLRYLLLLKLASLFDDDIAQRAWEARIEIDDAKAAVKLVCVCSELITRLGELPDERSRLLIGDALEWAQRNPLELHYNAKSKEEQLQVMPNVIGFQSVMHGVAARLKKHQARCTAIIVDQQSQFNKAQKWLSELFASARGVPAVNGPGLPLMDFRGMPQTPITVSSSEASGGLELVDIHLWVMKRWMENKSLAPELLALIQPHLQRGYTDEMSLNAISARWRRWFQKLPDPSLQQIMSAQTIIRDDEARRQRALAVSAG